MVVYIYIYIYIKYYHTTSRSLIRSPWKMVVRKTILSYWDEAYMDGMGMGCHWGLLPYLSCQFNDSTHESTAVLLMFGHVVPARLSHWSYWTEVNSPNKSYMDDPVVQVVGSNHPFHQFQALVAATISTLGRASVAEQVWSCGRNNDFHRLVLSIHEFHPFHHVVIYKIRSKKKRRLVWHFSS